MITRLARIPAKTGEHDTGNNFVALGCRMPRDGGNRDIMVFLVESAVVSF